MLELNFFKFASQIIYVPLHNHYALFALCAHGRVVTVGLESDSSLPHLLFFLDFFIYRLYHFQVLNSGGGMQFSL